MAQRPTMSVHANAHSTGADTRIRVTLTTYDDHGTPTVEKTWTTHCTTLWFEEAQDQAHHFLSQFVLLLEREGARARLAQAGDLALPGL